MDKQNLQKGKSPLKQTYLNFRTVSAREQLKIHKHDQILIAIQDEINSNSCDILDVILTDPLLKELNITLEKQAQQQKKSKLLESFPQRYRNLVHTETLYKQLQDNLKEVEKQSKEVIELQLSEKEELMAQIQYFKAEAKRKEEEKQRMKQSFEAEQMALSQSFQVLLGTKQKQTLQKTQEINDLQRKIIKNKCEKENMIEFLQEMKEEADILKKQNERIIQVITSHEMEISKLNQNLIDKQDEWRNQKQNLIEEFTKTENQLKIELDCKVNECNDLIIANESYKICLNKTQNQVSSLLNQHEVAETQRYEQIQQVRVKLLESVRQKNELDQQLQNLKGRANEQIESLSIKIQNIERELLNKNIEMSEKSLNHELQMHKLRQLIKKIEDSKDETIDQIRQNVNLITEEKLLLQSKVLKLESEKESLLNQHEKLKSQIDNHEKKLIQISWNTRKSEVKGVQIQKLVNQFKQQLSKFQEIINDKQEKIQQYRKDIISLRSKIKQMSREIGENHQNFEKSLRETANISRQIQVMKKQLSKCTVKENTLLEQIKGYSQILNKKKQEKETQIQVLEGINDEQKLKMQKLSKQLEKAQLKYENILEQLQQYKKQFKEQLSERDNTIKALETNNKHMKEMLGNKVENNSQISNLFNTKIEELKVFYEKKMEDEDKKYRKTIDVLKKEVTQLYKEIDLKKSMEEEMFNEIMKINKQRKAHQQEL